jgi:coniferyl-aldehyde dehydrogenase
MIKMSEYSPRCTEILHRMLSDIFHEDQVAVFGGGVDIGQAFSNLPFDHIVFTGSPAIGKEIMRAAANNLTPVTLELGGKSPAIVAPSASIVAAAQSIAHGKVFNSGQACVAPDYALVPTNKIDEFISAVVAAFKHMVPDPVTDVQYTSMASDRHAVLVQELLTIGKGAKVISCGAWDDKRIVPLQIVIGVTDEMRIMQEELFNPILPVMAYDSMDQAIRYVTARPRPLALYYYGTDKKELARWTRDVHCGGMTINDWAWHVFQCDLPFGGSGNSGIGSWRGPEGFLALSHAKAVFTEQRWFPVSLFRQPYGNLVQRMSLKFFLGDGDSAVGKSNRP